MNHRSIGAAQLHTLLGGTGELALIDIREVEDFRCSHIYHAAYLPASWSEGRAARVAALVPRRETTVVLVGDDPVVQREAALWIEWGYRDVRVLDGATDSWTAFGGRAFRNLCVPSKALAESARERFETPSVSVAELASRIDGRRPPVIVDVRSGAEYEEGSIPGALGLPGGELVASIGKILEDGDREVVVTCAGRTRAIFATQSLRDAGLPNPVVFLEGGTTAWTAAGRSLEPGARTVPDTHRWPTSLPDVEGYDAGIPRIDRAGVDELLADPNRTTYLIDPRLVPGAIPAGISGVRHVPGGQLVEAVDEYVPVLRARVVLVDDAPYVRAVALARWLRASRLVEVFVFDSAAPQSHPIDDLPTPTGSHAAPEGVDGLELDVRKWSLGLPQLAESEPGGGFAL
ncbi:rhodanese-like domain-containing protein [Rhodococcus globerulus]|uniref:thiosulfate sulfurtransferase n=1 Tax=Rhodococcus globerulus TaxID=33008 RepID=A0ABU4C5I6_RHOGO|nr:rhodanese-like domain-containing protein [Rhodococcus globerulus]MDV6271680.1 rhodanese-like domain-containing protein [Rhodococcus globerulus]